MWTQNYDPFGNAMVSTLIAAVPVVVLLGGIAFLRMKAHTAALLGLATALPIAIFVFGMPAGMASRAAVYGAAYGLLPIGWIILNVIFLYQLTQRARAVRRSSRGASPRSPTTAGCSCCSSPSASAPSSRVPPASARRSR